jgi:hypothetical protein
MLESGIVNIQSDKSSFSLDGTFFFDGIIYACANPQVRERHQDALTYLLEKVNSSQEKYIHIKDNTITNLLNLPITLTSTGNGYLQFSGSVGFQLPAGDISERPSAPVTGTTRWNTELDYLECYDGTVWAVSTGGGGEVTEEIAEDFGHRFTLIFG